MRGARVYAVMLIALLAVAVVPGVVEAAENTLHLVLHGDLAHSSRPGHAPFNQEHGCSPGCHLCSCCHSQTLEHSIQALTFKPPIPARFSPTLGHTPIGAGFAQTPQEPPRS